MFDHNLPGVQWWNLFQAFLRERHPGVPWDRNPAAFQDEFYDWVDANHQDKIPLLVQEARAYHARKRAGQN